MFAIGENLDAGKGTAEQTVQARASEEILVITFEQMPGHDTPIVEIGKQLQVWHGEKCAPSNDPSDLADEGRGILRVLDDFDANGAIVFRVRAGKLSGSEIHSTKRQAAPLEDLATMGVCFQA